MAVAPHAPVILVMGVSGCGKSTVAAALAARLGGRLIEADALHPPENIAHMSAGRPLDDAMRRPWLDRVAAEIAALRQSGDGPIVVACSALKLAYRDRLRVAAPDLRILCLTGSAGLLRRRVETREDHFMKASLLDSQLETLELPKKDEDAVVIDIDQPIGAIVDQFLGKPGNNPA